MNRKEQGSTLMEVIFAITIVAVAVTALLYGIINSTHTREYVSGTRAATILARSQMELIKAQAFEDVEGFYSPEIDDADDVEEPYIVTNEPDAVYDISVATANVTGEGGYLHHIFIVVEYGEGKRSVSLEGYMSTR